MAVLLVCATPFIISSCLNNDHVTRTQEMEYSELNTYLGNLIQTGYNVDTTDLGVYYIVRTEGEGPFPKQGDTLSIGYAGYFIDGTEFDRSDEFAFRYIDEPMLAGFEDGISLMNKGALIQMIIPSSLGYGASGTFNIPPYTTLVFVTEMKDIKPVATD